MSQRYKSTATNTLIPNSKSGVSSSKEESPSSNGQLKSSSPSSLPSEKDLQTKSTSILEDSRGSSHVSALNVQAHLGVSNVQEKKYLRLQGQVEETLTSLALLLASIPATQKDGIVLATRVVSLSGALLDVARRQQRFFDALTRIMEYSVYTALAGEIAIIGSLMLANHGIYPLKFLGVQPAIPEEKQNQPELSEEQRALIFGQLIARQETHAGDED
jgi:hypothetical protein